MHPMTRLTAQELEIKRKELQEEIENFCAENTEESRYTRLLPSKVKNLFYQVYRGKKSYGKAVKAKCLDCAQFDKKEITNCTCVSCPLYKLRPYQS